MWLDITASKVNETKAPRRKSSINKLYRKNQNDGKIGQKLDEPLMVPASVKLKFKKRERVDCSVYALDQAKKPAAGFCIL